MTTQTALVRQISFEIQFKNPKLKSGLSSMPSAHIALLSDAVTIRYYPHCKLCPLYDQLRHHLLKPTKYELVMKYFVSLSMLNILHTCKQRMGRITYHKNKVYMQETVTQTAPRIDTCEK